MTNSTSTSSSNDLEGEILDDFEENSDLGDNGTTKKLPGAFRTISEVAEEIHVPQHVLRFWETRFKQVQPVKRSGGRRYYRAEDIALLQYISELLYTQGYTIKGVQRLLEEDFSRFNSKNEAVDESISAAQNESAKDNKETITSDTLVAGEELSNSNDIEINIAEVTRLKEQNVCLTRSLQSVLAELQELRKIIAS